MSNKELAIQLLENVPPNKLGYVISYLQGITADEEADDEYCEALFIRQTQTSVKQSD